MQWIGYGYEMSREVLGDNFYAGPRYPRVVVSFFYGRKREGKCFFVYTTHTHTFNSANNNHINPVSIGKILDWSKLKGFADNKFNVAKIMISVLDKSINIEKRRKC